MDSPGIISHYFPSLTSDQLEKFTRLGVLYPAWNSRINVISRKDIDFLYERHVLHSLGIAKVCSFEKGQTILDVGTGGGFPGIPLAILFPETEFILLDSIGKKIRVVREICQSLGLENVSSTIMRAENFDGKVDFIISRAVTRIHRFLKWTQGKYRKESRGGLANGLLYLKGGDLTDELNEIKKDYTLYSLSDFFEGTFFETKKVLYVPA
jgi:16S rRNA (guanine527-N7)-methyltransferase